MVVPQECDVGRDIRGAPRATVITAEHAAARGQIHLAVRSHLAGLPIWVLLCLQIGPDIGGHAAGLGEA